ncbi:MAG: hypothetical protein H6728_09325 [Myxococcales bacterium]|nr:hypothetical protein [Myxococcales bacterium]MCB9643265.1 hypothetical protein [Myxococcales bacterium]
MRTCSQDGGDLGVCQGEVLPAPEVCGNNADDDCDGKTDENCPSTDFLNLPTNVSNYRSDIDVNAQKDIFLAFTRSIGPDGALLAHCWDASGKSKRTTFVVEETQDKNFYDLQVHASPDGSRWALAWRFDTNQNPQKVQIQIFDASCKPIPGRIELPVRSGSTSVQLAFGNAGDLAAAWRESAGILRVSLFDASGAPKGTGLAYENTPSVCSASSDFRLSRSSQNGSGIVTCQGTSYSSAYTFRRFNANGSWIETAPVPVVPTQNRLGSLGSSHLVGMNSAGAFVIMMTTYTPRAYAAHFYDAAGKFVKSVQYVTATPSLSSTFPYTADRIGVVGDDFILHSSPRTSPMIWTRYKSDGTLVSTSPSVTNSGVITSSSRFVGTNTYLLRSDRIDLKAITFP